MNWGQHISEISSKAIKTLGFLRRNLAFAPRSTKEVAYKTLVRPKLNPFGALTQNFRLIRLRQFRGHARWTCRRLRNTSSAGEMLDELEWPSLEVRRDRSSLLLFHKIHSGAVSIEKDKYLIPAHSLKSTRSSHSAQYCRYQTYSDALKDILPSPPPPTIPQWIYCGIIFHLRWSIHRLLRSLVKNTAERFFLFVCLFCCFFLQSSIFSLPGTMIIIW